MAVGVHMGSLRGAGTTAVGQNVAREMMRRADRRMLLWLPARWRFESTSGAEVRGVPASGILAKLRLENVTIRRSIRSREISSLFSLGDTSLPFCDVPHLLMVQQAFLAYPMAEWGVTDGRMLARLRLMQAYFRIGHPSVTRFTVQSATMRQRLSTKWGIAASRIRVVPSTVSDCFLELPQAVSVAEPYVCYVSTASPHKNHVVIADMLAALRDQDVAIRCHLSLSEEDVPALAARARDLAVLDRLVFRGAMQAREIRELLLGATAQVMPSKLESFGLPYYEAMACACPVIAADKDFARDACGETALYADPDDGASIAALVLQLLRDPAARAARGRAGRDRFVRINRGWASITEDYLALIEEIQNREADA